MFRVIEGQTSVSGPSIAEREGRLGAIYPRLGPTSSTGGIS